MRNRYIVKELLREITHHLAPHISRAPREAQLLLMAYFDVDELWLISHQEDCVEKDLTMLFEWVQRRIQQEPFEYIVQKVSFYSEEFYIDKGALIPRPETELLIDEVTKHIAKTAAITFVEVGIGSGIISIMLAKKFPNAKFIGVDISAEALRVAYINIKKFSLEDRIELREGSLLDSIDEEIDYLISNPPYIANDAPLEINLSYEPQNALFGGEVGDEIIRKLLDAVLSKKIKFFSCEMGYDQKDKIQNYFTNKKIQHLEFYKDYSGFDRGFTVKV